MNFREILKINLLKTRFVVFTYILIMFVVGILVDIVLFNPIPQSLVESFIYFATFERMPIATIVILCIVAVGIVIISKFGSKIMLSGSKYENLSKKETLTGLERTVANMVEEMAISANLGYIPQTYIMKTDMVNAFAAGWNKNNALVCVTDGIINTLTRNELQAVVAHEIGHILHGDSKLTLYVGILSNIILTIVNIFSFFIPHRSNNASSKARLILLLLNFILPLITSVLYFFLSRTREYMADAVAVKLVGDNQAMINALKKISGQYKEDSSLKGSLGEKYRSAAYIFQNGDSLFSTHPSIQNRIEKLS